MRRPAPLLAAALACAFPAAAQDLPPPLAAFAAEQSAACVGLGGTPRVGPAFATPVDLTGDGALDYIVDLAGVECANAWSAFCGSAGCPVSIWIAGPAGPTREWADYAQGWSIDAEGAEVAVVVERHGGACDAPGVEPCRERLVFAGAPVAPPEAAADADDVAPAAAPTAEATPATAPAEALAAPGSEGWTLREVPGSTPVAVSDAPGAVASVAVFCLAGQPWLAASLREPSAAETAEVTFAFAASSVSSTARREAQAGGALVIELADRPLAGLLSGRDGSARIALDGTEQGVLSLKGSTRAIRGALATCMPL